MTLKKPVIELDSVRFAYDGETVLDGISLEVYEHDFLALIGPNGGGKTTLLKLMAGILSPLSGAVLLFGNPPARSRLRIGYVGQHTSGQTEFPISVLDVTLMGRLGHGNRGFHHSARDSAIALEALEKVGMGALSRRVIGSLSGGQRQRVFLARALACDPELLILDEPTSGVDADGRKLIYDLLSSLRERMTIVVASHDQTLLFGYSSTVAYVNRTLHLHESPIVPAEAIPQLGGIPFDDVCPAILLGSHIHLFGNEDHEASR